MSRGLINRPILAGASIVFTLCLSSCAEPAEDRLATSCKMMANAVETRPERLSNVDEICDCTAKTLGQDLSKAELETLASKLQNLGQVKGLTAAEIINSLSVNDSKLLEKFEAAATKCDTNE